MLYSHLGLGSGVEMGGGKKVGDSKGIITVKMIHISATNSQAIAQVEIFIVLYTRKAHVYYMLARHRKKLFSVTYKHIIYTFF